jgi:hypothetical protein
MGYDEPETLQSQDLSTCLAVPDAEQLVAWIRNKLIGSADVAAKEFVQLTGGKRDMRKNKIVHIGVAAAIVMGLFPPWHHVLTGSAAAGYSRQLGYGFIGSPPDGGQIDIVRLMVQWALVAVATWGASRIWGQNDK